MVKSVLSTGCVSFRSVTLTHLSSLRLTAQLRLFEVTGLASDRPAPTLLSSRKAATVAGTPLLSILFETNPLDESANQRLHMESQPLEIIYDAVSGAGRWRMYARDNIFFRCVLCVSVQITVNSMSAFFMPPEDLQLDELTNATLMKLEQFRDRTATGQLQQPPGLERKPEYNFLHCEVSFPCLPSFSLGH